jgi:aspartate carbamoyltransferase catalytic subunit
MENQRKFTRKHLLGLEDLSREEIELILDIAKAFKEISTRRVKKVPTLRGRTVVNLFFEPSTRTRTSFELAAKRLSADVLNFSVPMSSIAKGESLGDTAKTIEAMQTAMIVIRHPLAGAPHVLSRMVRSSIINAGDGAHEHPTQGLLDIFTIRERRGSVEGTKVLIVGDILHSRVARSNIFGLTKLGAKVILCGPPTLIPKDVDKLGEIEVTYELDKAIPHADVIMMLRVQLERQKVNFFPTIHEYSRLYGLTEERLRAAKKDVVIMHPGPVNRGVELTPEVADGAHSLISEQVTNGVAVRMAVLYLLAGSGE